MIDAIMMAETHAHAPYDVLQAARCGVTRQGRRCGRPGVSIDLIRPGAAATWRCACGGFNVAFVARAAEMGCELVRPVRCARLINGHVCSKPGAPLAWSQPTATPVTWRCACGAMN